MFSGIVEESAAVAHFDKATRRLRLRSSLDHSLTKIGDSIAVDGVCLTVVEKCGNELCFDLAEETMRRTTLGILAAGQDVNLERSLKLGDRLHGHFDGVVQLLAREKDGVNDRLLFSYPAVLSGLIARKGSISVCGVSLTVGEVYADRFAVYIIPHTNQITKLAQLKINSCVNLEIDMLARYSRSILEARAGDQQEVSSRISEQFLAQQGYK